MGMAAVHKAGVIHHDLRAANVLLGSQPRFCRLTDFGLAKAKATSSRNSKSKTGNIVWLAPEYQLDDQSDYTEACDVFSFGVMLFEIAAMGERPYPKRGDAEVKQFYLAAQRDKLPADAPEEFKQLVQLCWSQSPKSRPTAAQIVEYINKTKMADPKLTC
jgi:serine/threonine protein kinase